VFWMSVALITAACVWCAYRLAENRRRTPFANRPVITLDRWFEKYYACWPNEYRLKCTPVLARLARVLRVDPSQFVPSDRLHEMRLHCAMIDDTEEEIEEHLRDVLGGKYTPRCLGMTVDELLRLATEV